MRDIVRTSKPTRAGATTAGAAGGTDPIAVGLQHLFAAVAEEPVPDEFMALLDRIEAAERQREAGQPPGANAAGTP